MGYNASQMSDDEKTEGGDRVFRYGDPPTRGFEIPDMDMDGIGKIDAHYERYFGKAIGVYHEMISDLIHLDVHVFLPTEDRDFYILATTGMSDRPMPATPIEHPELAHAELLIYLPPDWPLFRNGWQFTSDDAAYWPVRALKYLARMPHEFGSFLSWGHTIPNGPDAEPIGPDTELGCWCLTTPEFFDPELQTLSVRADKTVNFFLIVPIYREELEIKLKKRMEGLLDQLEKAKIPPREFFILTPNRRNAAAISSGILSWFKRR
jgi:hypothetical protein